MHFLLSVFCIAAGIFCIKIGTEWWVSLIAFGFAVLCLLIAFYKLGEDIPYNPPAKSKKPAQKKVKYPKQITYCLSLSSAELLAYAQKQAYLLRAYEKGRYNKSDDVFVAGMIYSIYHSDGVLSPAERDFCRAMGLHDQLYSDTAQIKKVSELLLKALPECVKAEQDAFLALAAAAVVAGRIEPYHLSYYKRLLQSVK